MLVFGYPGTSESQVTMCCETVEVPGYPGYVMVLSALPGYPVALAPGPGRNSYPGTAQTVLQIR
eukprot:573108-Rhodomonas_salina.1